jgi:hypothetical protein
VSTRFQRALSLLAGLAAIAVAVVLPLLLISNEFQKAESAHQWGGHPSAGVIRAVLVRVVLVGAAFAGGVVLSPTICSDSPSREASQLATHGCAARLATVAPCLLRRRRLFAAANFFAPKEYCHPEAILRGSPKDLNLCELHSVSAMRPGSAQLRVFVSFSLSLEERVIPFPTPILSSLCSPCPLW